MPEYLSPGVYVEEIDRGPKPIEGVGTAMAAFIGFTEKAEMARKVNGEVIVENLTNLPQLVTNWTQYSERFGSFVSGAYLPQAVYGYFQNGGSRCYVTSIRSFPKAEATLMNGQGKPALSARAKLAGTDAMNLRVRVANAPRLAAGKKEDKAEKEAEKPAASEPQGPLTFNFSVERQKSDGSWGEVKSFREVELRPNMVDGQVRTQVMYKNNVMPKFVELEVVEPGGPLEKSAPRDQEQPLTIDQRLLPSTTSSEFQGEVAKRTGMGGLEALDDVTMVCVPDLMTTMPGEKLNLDLVKAVQIMMISHCEGMGDRVAILDCPPDLTPQEIKQWRMDVTGFDSSYAALYYPWVQVMDTATNQVVAIPPSGHIAGVWSRNDNTRGVHKAPANEVVQGAVGVGFQLTKGEQDTLNPIGVNCIRSFPGRGIRVWGARTLSSNPSWRYINVRRLFNYVEKSIENGTQWIVFEPNNRKLWARVRRDVSAFLKMVWRDGALFGSTPEEAFYVRCDDELNPPESRDLGRLVIEIGMAPVKPAEFVIFRISQWAGPDSE